MHYVWPKCWWRQMGQQRLKWTIPTKFYEVILPYSLISHLASQTPMKWLSYAFINRALQQVLKSGPFISVITSKQMQHSSCPDCGMHLGFPWNRFFRQTSHLEMSWFSGWSITVLNEEGDIVSLLTYKKFLYFPTGWTNWLFNVSHEPDREDLYSHI